MPVRIYDISKKLGLENKEVLSKAKALSIAAKVASSSLDKITAEYLEQQIILDHPHLAAPPPAAPAFTAPQENVAFAAPPTAETLENQKPSTETATALLEPEAPSPSITDDQGQMAPSPPELQEPTALPEPVAKAPSPPPPPPGPKVGDKVGFVQLPPKPVAKMAEK